MPQARMPLSLTVSGSIPLASAQSTDVGFLATERPRPGTAACLTMKPLCCLRSHLYPTAVGDSTTLRYCWHYTHTSCLGE